MQRELAGTAAGRRAEDGCARSRVRRDAIDNALGFQRTFSRLWLVKQSSTAREERRAAVQRVKRCIAPRRILRAWRQRKPKVCAEVSAKREKEGAAGEREHAPSSSRTGSRRWRCEFRGAALSAATVAAMATPESSSTSAASPCALMSARCGLYARRRGREESEPALLSVTLRHALANAFSRVFALSRFAAVGKVSWWCMFHVAALNTVSHSQARQPGSVARSFSSGT